MYSCTYWNAESRLPKNIGATIIEVTKPTNPAILPIFTRLTSLIS